MKKQLQLLTSITLVLFPNNIKVIQMQKDF